MLTFGYDSDVDDALDQVVSITDALAGYAYAGTSRRVATTLGSTSATPGSGIVNQDFAGSGGYTGLDRFGRVKDLHFKNSAGATIHRYEYTHDPAGNPTSMKLTKGQTYQGALSRYYVFDGLQRLIEAQKDPQPQDGSGPPYYSTEAGGYSLWNLDILGNWAGQGDLAGRMELDGESTPVSQVTHVTDAFNRIEQVITDDVPQTLKYDLNDNLIFTGQYVLWYDPWNRLVAVDGAGTLTAEDFTDQGAIDTTSSGHAIGEPVLRMAYDAVGRLMRVQRPVPPTPGSSQRVLQTEDYYYEGVRRIQEVITRPDGQGGSSTWTDREYVYGPDYIDEFIAQIDKPAGAAAVRPIVQDDNYNVVAVLDGAGQVLAEYAYDPYGQPVDANQSGLTAESANTAGHQGLFAYRLSPCDNNGLPLPLDPTVEVIYYNRNRWYLPKLGRFTSPDPNETAMPVMSALMMNAETALTVFDAFSPEGHFGNGMNLYQYEGSNPLRRIDPLGLDSWDNEVDDQISDIMGQRLYALGMINEGAKYASIGIKTALNIAASFMPGYGLYEAFKSVKVIANGKGGFWDAVNIAMAAFPIAKGVGKAIGLSGLFRAGSYVERACNSFVAGTLVETPEGQHPIETLKVGDRVATRDENDPGGPLKVGRVTQVVRGTHAVLLWLTLAQGQVMGITPNHEIWTYEHGWIYAQGLQPGDTLQDSEGQAVKVVDVQVDRTVHVVYNLEINGTATYFAEGVWVHNVKGACDRRLLGRISNAFGHSFEVAILEVMGLRKYVGKKLSFGGTNFVPDFLENGIIGDIKSSEYVYMTPQLKAMGEYAKQNGLTAILFVADKASAEVQKLFQVVKVP